MTNARRSLITTGVLALIVLALLTAGGIVVRNYLSGAFFAAERVRDLRDLGFTAVREQLDEETGLRGFAATGDRRFLEPYETARPLLVANYAELQERITRRQPNAVPLLLDAHATSDRWTATVAEPILRDRRHSGLLMELHGKALMDRFRADMAGIDVLLAARETRIVAESRSGIDRINLFVGVVTALLLGVTLIYGAQQVRVATRLAAEERRAEIERRELSKLQAAYAVEKRIADTLQDAFTQRPLPVLPSLRFSATYVPATEDTRVGGDWYDALELPHGRVLFAIGDVTGHGIEAAVAMNRSRQALISSALLDADPAAVLSRVNEEMASQNSPLVTAIAGFADARTFEFVFAVAGHPPPVLLEPGRAPRLLGFGSLPLGAMAGTTYRTDRVQTVPGAMLVLYTDGAVEHSHDVLAGEELLLRAVTSMAEQASTEPATFIHDAIFAGRHVGDDVAILTIGFAADSATGMTISAETPQSAFASRAGRSAAPAIQSAVQWRKQAS